VEAHALTILVVLALLAGGGGCGESKPEPVAPVTTQEAPPPVSHAPRLSVASELGEIDPKAADKTFEKLQPQLMSCYAEGQQRIEFLSGDVKFFLRIAQDGSVHWSYLEESSMGDRDTERCMLDALGAVHWPQPQGGEAEVRKSLGFDAPGNVRAPVAWETDRVAATLGKHGDEANKCKQGVRGTFHVTAYVEPHGKGAGKVQAVGVAPPSKDGEDKVDCIVEAVKKLKMPSPGSYAAKVSFIL
jgi:hypothetical protein